jgi:hypothetical protein
MVAKTSLTDQGELSPGQIACIRGNISREKAMKDSQAQAAALTLVGWFNFWLLSLANRG